MFIRGLELGLLTVGNRQFPNPAPDEQPVEQSQLAPRGPLFLPEWAILLSYRPLWMILSLMGTEARGLIR